ncbi:uncharacterized protein [Triticum aestivum]|uniref:uncharacterized protein isoform X2 n=1 Tax=Triticum aestivum TaxID=4565 RepID=UPI001D016748|nr:uncharacterized protein LOC123104207 isoform X2 [Triticum aestivum]
MSTTLQSTKRSGATTRATWGLATPLKCGIIPNPKKRKTHTRTHTPTPHTASRRTLGRARTMVASATRVAAKQAEEALQAGEAGGAAGDWQERRAEEAVKAGGAGGGQSPADAYFYPVRAAKKVSHTSAITIDISSKNKSGPWKSPPPSPIDIKM